MINTDFLKRRLSDEEGAASVLVIFLMLVFVTMGAFAITSANANFKLSQRAHEWNEMYYGLDAKGEEYLAQIDAKLIEAEAMAYDYITNERYSTAAETGIPAEMQADLYGKFMGNNLQISEAINSIYMYYSNIYINTLANENLEVYTIENGLLTDSVLAMINVKSDMLGDDLCGLNISVRVEPIEYMAGATGRQEVTRANGNLRYKIEDWFEYQESKDEEVQMSEDLWDGSF